MINILVLYYSRGGATRELAYAIAEGIESTGAVANIRTVAPVSPEHQQTSPSIPDHGDLYCSKNDLLKADGLLLGSPTRFGNMAAPLKYFIDTLSDVWVKGSLNGKPAGVFTSSSSLHGGQESTLLSMMLPLLHQGMLIVGLPYSESELHTTQSGGGPYGASHWQHADNVSPDNTEYKLAFAHGRRVATIAEQLCTQKSS
ncbi:NAD(P)H:quinone oxidoreductase [Gayadomonas joobiniege]|uniref:NAD(P)H:quinone oxidoreductase n=1 Tax=Gayadomonas joobiniege TaxID=1234606 RepID=UPI00037F3B86|nr:NAD(P)H:quinone oxidoreductase [Gayadomonas joobiniege]